MQKYFILFVTFSLMVIANTFPKTTSLDGSWLYYVQNLTKNTQYEYMFNGDESKIDLPKNWYKHGINHAGIIWFERNIHMKDLPLATNHLLEFTGVDYLCEVWVNGTYVGNHEGYFQTFSFDISSHLKQGNNTIKVKVNSPLENYPEHYSLHKTLLRGIFSHHDTRPGGAWSAEGQDKNSGGIWNHISIKSYKKYKFSELKVTPKISLESVSLALDFSLKKLKQEAQSSFLYYKGSSVKPKRIHVKLIPKNFQGKSFSQNFTVEDNEKYSLQMQLKNAKLWYTHDRGFPHLYTLTIQYGNTQISEDIGFKSLTQDSQKVYALNGKSFFIKGTNYISSQYMSEMNIEALRKDLILMKEAHINTIRVHAHIEPKRFYALCDAMGFLVWQDYNLQWGYIDTPAFEKEAIKQAKEMVDMLYNHPSIYIWSMHNEPPWNSDWMKWKYSDYNTSINKNLDNVLYEAIQTYDNQHLSKKLSSNLEHPWFGWYSGKYEDFRNPSKVPVISEYGAQAIPKLSNLKKFIPKKYLNPKGKRTKKHWEYHNYQFNWSQKNGVKFKKDIKTFIHDSQTYQAELIKFATEMLRIQKYTKTTAIFQFMFNEGWPSMNWGIVDYYRDTKPGYEALKKAFAPLIVVAKRDDNKSIELYAINDTLQQYSNETLKVEISSIKGKETKVFTVDIPEDSVTKITTLVGLDDVNLSLSLTTGNSLVSNAYIFNDTKVLEPFTIVAKQTKNKSIVIYVQNNTKMMPTKTVLHMTVKTKNSKKVYKFDVSLKPKELTKVTSFPINETIEIFSSLESDSELDYKHFKFNPLNKIGADQ
ncbi:MAG TPA: hypothetical protein EYG83_04270 [Sulfurospirillum arcachonense]|nr:hypothetical protein [Sulfurospirillum arcachonense]